MDYQADLGCFLDYYPDYLDCLDCPDYLGYCLGYPGCYLGYWNYYCYSEFIVTKLYMIKLLQSVINKFFSKKDLGFSE